MSNLLRRFTSQSGDSGTRSVSVSGSEGVGGGSSVVPSRGHEHGQQNAYEENRREDEDNGKSLRMSQTISFSDFSMHVMDEDRDHQRGGLPSPPRIVTKPVAIPGGGSENNGVKKSLEEELRTLRIDTKGAPTSPLSKSLGIPSVASIFGTPKVGLGGTGETPRSSLDLYDSSISSAPTPTRTSADGEESVPVSPRSPKTPGGRRRKQKINGLDSFEWLELVRGSSL